MSLLYKFQEIRRSNHCSSENHTKVINPPCWQNAKCFTFISDFTQKNAIILWTLTVWPVYRLTTIQLTIQPANYLTLVMQGLLLGTAERLYVFCRLRNFHKLPPPHFILKEANPPVDTFATCFSKTDFNINLVSVFKVFFFVWKFV